MFTFLFTYIADYGSGGTTTGSGGSFNGSNETSMPTSISPGLHTITTMYLWFHAYAHMHTNISNFIQFILLSYHYQCKNTWRVKITKCNAYKLKWISSNKDWYQNTRLYVSGQERRSVHKCAINRNLALNHHFNHCYLYNHWVNLYQIHVFYFHHIFNRTHQLEENWPSVLWDIFS